MASITGMTAEAINTELDKMVTSVRVDTNGQLIYMTKNGQETTAGPVISPLVAVEKSYPVGSLYFNISTTSPADLLGIGTWVRYGEGKVFVSQLAGDPDFGVGGAVGGFKTHTLSVAEMPTHNHNGSTSGASDISAYLATNVASTNPATLARLARGSSADPGVRTIDATAHNHTIPSQGGGSAHNNLQPFIVIYAWRRTA